MTRPPAGSAFTRGGPDRADHLRDDDAALDALWADARLLVLDAEGRAVCAAPEGPAWIPPAEMAPVALRARAVFLGLAGDGRGWFALPEDALHAERPPHRLDLRAAAHAWPEAEASAFAQARAMLHWQARHRFCGACGGEVALRRAGHAARCTRCGLESYPRTDPAVIVLISDGERALLGRQASWPPGRYSVIAGFVEPGERLEDAVVREAMEEAGVRVHACRYVASQPWPFPSSLMLGFRADAAPDAPRYGTELEHAAWFTRASLREAIAAGTLQLPPSISISRRLIEDWLGEDGQGEGGQAREAAAPAPASATVTAPR